MKIVNYCNRVIEYSFYALLFFVPLIVISDTSELFEFNKLWLTFAITIIIGAAWISKMIAKKEFRIQKTSLDIPIALFFLSQVISTFLSLDPHTSIWGYYTRFNGGLFSIFTYIFLYYAFVSNLDSIHFVKRIIGVSLIAGTVVSLWGFPSHFGYDPTCFVFRGTLDVSCWTSDFQPKIRIFSTLGQPDWLAAYLSILIPVTVAFFINSIKKGVVSPLYKKFSLKSLGLLLVFVLFYIDLLYAKSRSATVSSWISLIVFAGLCIWIKRDELKKFALKNFAKSNIHVLVLVLSLLLVTFFTSTSISQVDRFGYSSLKSFISKTTAPKVKKEAPKSEAPQATEKAHVGELGGTDSFKIRLIVWEGAIDAWKNNPIFGTGVETFAFAYYKYRPAAHNLTSEWNFLYNKAHNEYLNYLATTGLVGFLSYLSIIFVFLWIFFSDALKKLKIKELNSDLLIIIAFASGYLSILMSNFFGFSVVMVNIYFFLIPAITLILLGKLDRNRVFVFAPKPKKVNSDDKKSAKVKFYKDEYKDYRKIRRVGISLVFALSAYLIYGLYTAWIADKAYALGQNLDRVGQYQQAYPSLKNAISLRPSEPMFLDEFSINNAVLSITVLQQQKDSTGSADLANKLAEDAVALTNKITLEHPNNVVFAKTKVRVLYTLGQANPQYYVLALQAIEKAAKL
ncbi:O-antigen ligase family protein, partial [Patescibacteria group bacterium]|nr:O-antigen ligase family protein [Patescibacteria group bacterium]